MEGTIEKYKMRKHIFETQQKHLEYVSNTYQFTWLINEN